MNNNLEIYEKVREVPKEAQKLIAGGRLKDKTDINPMWRIKILTQLFGPCGFGWRYEILNQWIEEGANGEKSAFANINLYIKHNEQWSEAIPGTGGNTFIAKESKGLYTDDDCYKKALTDAISVSCKALGVGADIYWQFDKTKYDNPTKADNTTNADNAENNIRKILINMCFEITGDKSAIPVMLENYSKFISKDGKSVAGIKDHKKLNGKRLAIAYDKAKKEYIERFSQEQFDKKYKGS